MESDSYINAFPEEIIDKYGNIYKENLAEKTIISEDEESKKILSLARKIYLNELRFHNKIKNFQYFNEIYIISIEWFNKFKEYSNYKLIKRISRNLDLYLSKKQIIYKLDSNKFPGKITNESLIITSDTNILSSDYYFVKDDKKEKIDFKIFPKESFDILNEEFGCDYIIKSKIKIDKENNLKKYNIYSKKFNVTFIPIKQLLLENSEIQTYEIYFPLLLSDEEIYEYLANILNKYKILKKQLGISLINKSLLKLFLKIYRLNKDNLLQKFIEFINEKKEELKEGNIILGSDYLQKIPEKFQIKQLTYNNLIIEFSYYKNGEYFNNLKQDIIIEKNKLKELIIRNKALSNTENDDIKYKITYSTKEKLKRKKSSPRNFFYNKRTELRKETLDKNDNKHGLVGLGNIGNTCYMDTSLQCLSNCKILTDYFLEDKYKKFINENNPIGSHGKLVESYAELIKHLWYGQKDSIEPYSFKETIGNIRTMFRGYQQQDTQEFLSFLLDGLHEDLNKVLNKPYVCPDDNLIFENNIEEFKYFKKLFLARNQSLIIDLFYGMFKSTLFCPNQECNNVSNTFDPYAIISLPLIIRNPPRKIDVYFIYENIKYKLIKFKIEINNNTTIRYFREKINYILKCGLNTFEIYLVLNRQLILINETKYNTIVDFLKDNDTIFLNQISSHVFENKNTEIDKTYEEILETNSILYDRIKEFDKNEGKIEGFEQIEEKFEREKYMRCLFYNFSYNIRFIFNEDEKNDYPPKDAFLFPRVFYFNIEMNNTQILDYLINYYRCIYDVMENEENFKEEYFKDYEENSQKVNNNSDFTFTYSIHESLKYPFVIMFIKTIKAYSEEGKDSITPNFYEKDIILEISENKYIIKENIEKIKLEENESLNDYQLNFKIAWLPNYEERIEYLNTQETIEKRRWSFYNSDDDELNLNLIDLLENFGKLEQLTEENKWYCPKCKEHQLAKKKMVIFTCPEILIIHLKRFKNTSKLGNLVNFPIENLDMGKYIIYNEIETNDNIYDLFAVANHFGGLHGGHYIAYCKNYIENKWYEFNDSCVSEIDESSIVSRNAYVLFYKKRNTLYPNIEELYQKSYEEIDIKK